jgi:hypothetical protein
MPMLAGDAVCSMPSLRTQSSVPSEPSFTCTMIWWSNAEWRRRLSTTSLRYGRLFQVGMMMENMAGRVGGRRVGGAGQGSRRAGSPAL